MNDKSKKESDKIMWKLKFGKDIRISKLVERISDEKQCYVDIETVEYDDFKNVHVLIAGIEYENDQLVIYSSEIRHENRSVHEKTINIRSCKILIGEDNIQCSRYVDILINTTNWLFKHEKLQEKDLPVYVPHGKRYLINTIPCHEYGRKFDGKACKIGEDVYLMTNASGKKEVIKWSRYLMSKFAPDIKFKIIDY